MVMKQITIRVFAILVIASFLVGCNATPTVVQQPTSDVPAIRTESAATVIARLTIEAALNPSATPVAPTETEQPVLTATQEPSPTSQPTTAAEVATATATATQTAVSGGNTGSGTGSGVAGGSNLYPTTTPRRIPDQAVFVEGTPFDGQKFAPGSSFDAVWRLKNTGTTTWTTDYHLRFARGTNMAEADRYYLAAEVKPGETVNLTADMIAPSERGIHVGYWEFVNGNGDIIFTMYAAISVE